VIARAHANSGPAGVEFALDRRDVDVAGLPPGTP